ncbi:hypothetical protein MSHOH_2137 [Methanosarcina horonobensis HB-1 = JCM 15518]|uniref:Uncharacterized protein n=1 Tax=Methanosarcina horonobensis HB-1 = JCM 15518 TaxID=1434110 RepID=A0A0E3WU00_9EURY|nr:hypothetical protein [Methanosarcina horonobensis]AKB78620.1 hypothetical protein MSHOH_2137 [Methanosarcina horonobensis HB-1 = JCM 15518]
MNFNTFKKLFISFVLFSALIISTVSGQPVICPGKNVSTCYDFAVSFQSENPGWGIVSLSTNQQFRGVSHIVNYQVEGDTLVIHDGMYLADYEIPNYQDESGFFHFWINETPIRYYDTLSDNRNILVQGVEA